MNSKLPLVLHIPHSSKVIPNSLRASFLLSDSELERELLCMTDAYTDELFQSDLFGASTVHCPVSRLVVDPERFESDAEESMAQVGMGVIYIKTSDRRALRMSPTESERQALLEAYYRPHHKKLERVGADALQENDRCLVVDCHSFPSKPLPYEVDQDPQRPDICIGTDDFHTPPALVKSLVAAFETAGYKVSLNRPFSGALVPYVFYRREPRVASVMIEINRGLYMNENTGEKSIQFQMVHRSVAGVLGNVNTTKEHM